MVVILLYFDESFIDVLE